MNENILTWNVANWVTVVLMASVGLFVLALIGSLVKGNKDSGGDE